MAKKNFKNPYDIKSGLSKLDNSALYKELSSLVKATNQKLRELEKKGYTSTSPVYNKLKSSNRVTSTGNVGYSLKGLKKLKKTDLLKEYKKVYKTYSAKSITSSDKYHENKKAEQLAYIGVDYYEMSAAPIEFKKQLNIFWELYTELEKQGVFEEFGLGSYQAIDTLKEYTRTNKLPASKGAAKSIARNVKKNIDITNAESIHHSNMRKDEYFKAKYVDDSNKIDSIYKQLLKYLAEKAYGTKPVEGSFTKEDRKRSLL